ncbi:MAG: DUF4388 domain-containing protein [Myxococcaceae bacterium]
MALKGTLKDFGIADILQLIGQQGKTGQLHLKSRDQEVVVAFQNGNIVRAESSTRNKKDLIGSMLVRAELITEAQLEFALEAQKRTLQRLGDVLTQQGVVAADRFKQMVQLQTTETLYRLFGWKTGNYEFEQVDVEVDPSFTPLRAESVLMEGFRLVDEWPVVRRKITSYALTFDKLKELPPAPLKQDAFDEALDNAFGDKPEGASSQGSEFQAVGEFERKVYNLVGTGRTVRRLIDLACLGEFETCKALCNLVNLEYLRVVPTVGHDDDIGDDEGGRFQRVSGILGRVAVTMLVIAGLIFVGSRVDFGALRLGGGNASSYTDPAIQRFISRQQISRIAAALDVYKLEKGQLPDALDALVDTKLLREDDLKYPWRDTYYYRREAGSYVLLPPLR